MAEIAFRAMGTDVHLIAAARISGRRGARRERMALEEASETVRSLDLRWSRFDEASEISLLNTAAGHPFGLSKLTFGLLERCCIAWRRTAGLFDPTVLGPLLFAGYDATFELLAGREEMDRTGCALEMGCGGIVLDRRWRTVEVPRRVGVDVGGIAKGAAADLVVDAMMRHLLAGACVNIGGDVACRGRAPEGTPWIVGVEGSERYVALTDGAVATSATTRRRWSRGGIPAHHLIDPRTALPADSAVESVTVTAPEGWRAEAASTAALVAGSPDAAKVAARLGARLVTCSR